MMEGALPRFRVEIDRVDEGPVDIEDGSFQHENPFV
jgi:hypothetical protein